MNLPHFVNLMDAKSGRVRDVSAVGQQETSENVSRVESLNQRVDEIFIEVDKLEKKVNEIEQFYSNSNPKNSNTQRSGPTLKDKDREKLAANFMKRQQDLARKQADAARRKQDLMNQFESILLKMTQLKWAAPFLKPVDVVGLGLHDYYESQVIEKPMDFSTIKSKMEARDGTGYKNVREICADVRLIFKNAMKYNDEKEDVHVMAKSLLDKFETKWLKLLPKVDEDEKLRKEEESEMQLDMQLAQEVAQAKLVRHLGFELDKVDAHLKELKEIALQKCRKMTTEEKKRLGTAITRLAPDDINKALEIIAQNEPTFQTAGEVVEVDIDAQRESTLWKLKLFVKDTLQAQLVSKNPTLNNTTDSGVINPIGSNRRKRELCDALAKNSHKRSKKLPG
ncbi:bromodomain-containing protein [Striga asiatica]|uniref:Bromodomain-containing protein n=1 Tax=Striga asiatica TaxID=4170 RepID=A0A5A7R4E6_STRAF|nr:bromodomain-containing protein [Striga asiatica]